MGRPIVSLNRAWRRVGALLAIIGALLASGAWLLPTATVPSGEPAASSAAVAPKGQPSRSNLAGDNALGDQRSGDWWHGWSDGTAPGWGGEAAALYAKLLNPDPAEVIDALHQSALHAEDFYPLDALYKRVMELCADSDPQVAEKAQHALQRLRAHRLAHEIPEPPALSDSADQQGHPGVQGAEDLFQTSVEAFQDLARRVLNAPDPAVRLGGIEAAIRQDDEQGFYLLSKAALGDPEAENRLAAVSELEQMLGSGLGDRERLLALLRETAWDRDPRVAELSALILREQAGGEGVPPPLEDQEAHQEAEQLHAAVDQIAISEEETVFDAFATRADQLVVAADPGVRLTGIETAGGEGGDEGFDLVAQTALGDAEADIRLSAVSELERMLNSGAGSREQILRMLEATSVDPDPRVAELSQLILEEQEAASP